MLAASYHGDRIILDLHEVLCFVQNLSYLFAFDSKCKWNAKMSFLLIYLNRLIIYDFQKECYHENI